MKLMEKLLLTLLDNDILNEETKSQLEEAVKETITEAIDNAKKEAEIEIRAELTKQFLDDKKELVEALDTKAEEFLQKEVAELKEDIERFRELDVEYATRLVEHKEEVAKTLKGDLEELVEALDVFMEMRLRHELLEFSDSIEEVKKITHGKEIFEQFEEIYLRNFADNESSVAKLEESSTKLAETTVELKEAQAQLNKVQRAAKMEEVLSDLDGRPREIMEAVLKSVPTDQLDEGYDNFISKVLHESAEKIVEDAKTEKEATVLAENDSSTKEKIEEVVSVTGDAIDENVETDEENLLSESERNEILKLVGV